MLFGEPEPPAGQVQQPPPPSNSLEVAPPGPATPPQDLYAQPIHPQNQPAQPPQQPVYGQPVHPQNQPIQPPQQPVYGQPVYAQPPIAPQPQQQVVVNNNVSGSNVIGTKGPNHALHFVLTLVTAGIWLPVWIIIAIRNKQKPVFA